MARLRAVVALRSRQGCLIAWVSGAMLDRPFVHPQIWVPLLWLLPWLPSLASAAGGATHRQPSLDSPRQLQRWAWHARLLKPRGPWAALHATLRTAIGAMQARHSTAAAVAYWGGAQALPGHQTWGAWAPPPAAAWALSGSTCSVAQPAAQAEVHTHARQIARAVGVPFKLRLNDVGDLIRGNQALRNKTASLRAGSLGAQRRREAWHAS